MWDTIGSIYYAVMIFSVPAAIVTLLFSVAAISEADEEKYLKYSFQSDGEITFFLTTL